MGTQGGPPPESSACHCSSLCCCFVLGSVSQSQTGGRVATGTRAGLPPQGSAGGSGQPAEQGPGHSPP